MMHATVQYVNRIKRLTSHTETNEDNNDLLVISGTNKLSVRREPTSDHRLRFTGGKYFLPNAGLLGAQWCRYCNCKTCPLTGFKIWNFLEDDEVNHGVMALKSADKIINIADKRRPLTETSNCQDIEFT